MGEIDFLENGGGHLSLLLDGRHVYLADPTEMHYQRVLMALSLEHVPGIPGMPWWQARYVFERWRQAWDLPTFNHARRLAYLVDTYRPAIANDLQVHAGVDLGRLWRARRWTHLLDLIDHLPAHSWYAATVATDAEHAEMMVQAIMAERARRKAAGEDEGDKNPSMVGYTAEVAALNNILDAVRDLQHTTIAAAGGKGERPKPVPRPVTALEKALKRAEYKRRQSAHESLVARVLPHKRKSQGPVH